MPRDIASSKKLLRTFESDYIIYVSAYASSIIRECEWPERKALAYK